MHNGKGDKPRPMFITRKQWEENWDRVFGKKDDKKDDKKEEKCQTEAVGC